MARTEFNGNSAGGLGIEETLWSATEKFKNNMDTTEKESPTLKGVLRKDHAPSAIGLLLWREKNRLVEEYALRDALLPKLLSGELPVPAKLAETRS